VNTICPGGVLTPLMEHGTTPEFRQMVSKRLIPLGRMCSPDEIGQAAIFFASDRSNMVTGQLLAVDGGLMTGFGEDLRPLVRKRMEEAKQKKAQAS
jgi:NAD(P)-dependent dehydrogenase (short-subunit alcohol dehydrogenase family)